jgi:Uncharacterized conserved protein
VERRDIVRTRHDSDPALRRDRAQGRLFRQVHREDGGRIRFRRVCSIDGEEVPYADVAKGYELPNGEMVVLTDEDLAELPLPTAHGIEVLHFSPVDQVDPIMWERSYYTEPEPQGVRAYALLRDALERSGMVAVAKVALRNRESLAGNAQPRRGDRAGHPDLAG